MLDKQFTAIVLSVKVTKYQYRPVIALKDYSSVLISR